MNFWFIRKQAATLSMTAAKHGGKRAGIGAILCTVLGVSAFAQGQLDFLDPLDEERVRIEKTGKAPALSPDVSSKPAKPAASANGENSTNLLSRARNGAASGAAVAQERADGLWSRMKSSLGEVAASLGLPTAGLLGLLGLLLAGLACLVGWTLFRGRRGRTSASPTSGVYQRDGKGRGRRKPGDLNPLAKTKAAATDTFEETMPEDFETIFRDEAAVAPATPVPPKTSDTTKWRKPNLDKLRASIKADWKADKVDAAEAGLASAGAGALAATAMAASSDPADRTLDEVSDGWEAWDTQVKPEDDPWGENLVTGDDDNDKDDAALRRIRALRESLKAS